MISIKKQVEMNKYDKEYFGHLFKSPDYSKRIKLSSFGHIYRDLARLHRLSEKDKVVDFGCGNGELSFCLYQKYKPSIIGIDYSADAIDIAKDNLKKLTKLHKSPKISFLNVNNEDLPSLKDINCVYFCDVLEHLYDQEIAVVLKQVKSWNENKIKILIHTDNNVFLRFIRPLLDLLSVLSKTSTVEEIKRRNQWESERHVNLTNPKRFRKAMSQYGFYQVRVIYSDVSMENIEKQLAGLAQLPFLRESAYFFLRVFKSLSPSFYGVYEYQSK